MLFSSPPWDSVVYWALDLETGGFDAKKDAILAVGMVPIRGGFVRLAEAYTTLVRPDAGTGIDPESVRAHQLLWGEVREAPPLTEVLPEVNRRAHEGVLLVHNRAIDVGFLKRAHKRKGFHWYAPRVVDTVDLLVRAARRLHRSDAGIRVDLPNLNLAAARQEYGLPEYQAHDALTDAIATAELFLMLRLLMGARTVRDLR